MAKPNYAFQKRQRELAKKQKKEEKLRQKAAGAAVNTESVPEPEEAETPQVPPPDEKG